MKRDKDCKGCSWNFGKPDFPCPFCEEHDLYTNFPYHYSEDQTIQKFVKGIISAMIYLLLPVAMDIDITEIMKDATLQQEDNSVNEL